MHFKTLCEFYDNVRNSKGGPPKTTLVRDFMKTLRKYDQPSAYTILRLLLPKLDRERDAYRIKESKISKLVIKMLDLPPGNDRNLLSKSIFSSDFGQIVFSVLKKYIVNQQTSISVKSLDEYLDKISKRTSDKGLDDLILEIFRKMAPKDAKWFVQIILKDLHLGVSDKTILNCFHEDAANFYDNTNNLRKICETLWNPEVKLHVLGIKVFEPFRPMLSKRCDAGNFKKCFPETRKFIVENKFDGERFQIHMKGGVFKYFSRNGFDFTKSYEENLTSKLKNVFDPKVSQFVLDGEMMIWNNKSNCFGSKGMNLDVKKLSAGKYQPCFCVFDILVYEDRILTNESLWKRIQILTKLIKNPIIGSIVVSESKEANSLQDIVDALNASIDLNEEGIVVKDTKSIYKCSDRNSGWFKLKMDYFDDVVHDLDLILMGGTYGGNNRLNSFMVGVSSGPDTYLSMGSVSSGLNNEQLDLLDEKLKLQGHAFTSFSTKTEGKLSFGREKPDVYIEPKHSLILQIRASELTRTTSDGVKTPYTLRFPRVLKIRDDKPVNECLSMNELLELTGQNKSVIKLNKRHIDLSEIVKKISRAKITKLDVVNFKHQKDLGKFLKGKRIHVFSDCKEWTIEDIYNSVKRAGGEPVYKLGEDVDVVLVGLEDESLLNVVKHPHSFDVVYISWLKRVFENKELVEYNQEEVVSVGHNFKGDLSQDCDIYGDSFKQEATRESLQRILDIMDKKNDFFNANNAVDFN